MGLGLGCSAFSLYRHGGGLYQVALYFKAQGCTSSLCLPQFLLPRLSLPCCQQVSSQLQSLDPGFAQPASAQETMMLAGLADLLSMLKEACSPLLCQRWVILDHQARDSRAGWHQRGT